MITSKQISAAFDAIGMSYAKQHGNVYPYIKRGELASAFGTLCAGSSDRTKKLHEFKLALRKEGCI